ncbi:Cupredoxin, partial [Tribonema minus]
LQVTSYTNTHGTFQTRTFNGMLPGPLMRMEACGVYSVTLNNRMQGYLAPFPEAPFNSYRDPLVTNMHTHGLHVSGAEGGDDMTVEIQPGADQTYIYKIPCDHTGGLHWYHPHHHGSTTLQAGAGAAGLLVVE